MPRGTSAVRRRRQRHDRHRRLLALELVDGADRHVGQAGVVEASAQLPDLRVVGRDDDDVAVPQRARPGRGAVGTPFAGSCHGATEEVVRPGRARPSASSGGPGRVAVVVDEAHVQAGLDAVEVPGTGRPVLGAQLAVVGQPRDRRGEGGVHAPRRRGSSRARRASTSSPSSQPSAEASTGSGWVPWLTCGSCCGSPSSSSRSPATEQAMVVASENWPASSTTSRSSWPRPTRRVLVKSQAVPPTTKPRPA